MNVRALLLIASLALSAVLFLQFRDNRAPAPPPPIVPIGETGMSVPQGIALEGWSHVSGNVERTEDDRFVTPTGLTLSQDGIEAEFAEGSEFRFEEGIPVLDQGSLEVRTEKGGSFGPIQIPAGSDLTFEETRIIVGAGGALIDGVSIPGGAAIRRDRVTPPRETQPRAPSAGFAAAGVVRDGATGNPIINATIAVIVSDQREGDPVASEASERVFIQSDASGRFTLPNFSTTEPQRWVRLEVRAEGYAPLEWRTTERPSITGELPFIELTMRRAWWTAVDFRLDDQSPISFALVEVRQRADSVIPEEGAHPLREGDEWISLRTTDESGRLPVRLLHESIRLQHPTIVSFPDWLQRPEWAGTGAESGVSLTGEMEPITALFINAPHIDQYQLVDADGVALADVPIEVEVPEDVRRWRVRTDAEGMFLVGVADRDPAERRTVVRFPKTVNVRILDPQYRDYSHRFTTPGHPERLYVSGRPTLRLSMSLVEMNSDSESVPFPAEQIALSVEDLVCIERTAGGRAVFTGIIPEEGEEFWLTVRDAEPLKLRMPERPNPSEDVDLGTVVVTRPDPVRFIFPGVNSGDLEGAILEISGDDPITTHFRYRISGAAPPLIGGLNPDQFYRFRVLGPWLDEVSGEFRLSDQTLDEGFAIPLFDNEAHLLRTDGGVLGIEPDETRRYRVIERFYREDDRDPVITRSYPLPPDASFGSERRIPGVVRAETLVVSRDALFAHGPPTAPQEPGYISFLSLPPEPPRLARFAFRFEDIGTALVPEAWLEGFEDRNHEVLSAEPKFPEDGMPHLEVRSFLPGSYALHWQNVASDDGVFPFRFLADQREFDAIIDLPAAETNRVLLRIQLPDGDPATNAFVTVIGIDEVMGETDPAEAEAVAPGLYALTLYRDLPHRITVRPNRSGVVVATLDVPTGAELSAPLELRAATDAVVEIHDSADRPLEGSVVVVPLPRPAGEGWPEGVMIHHGQPTQATMDRGEAVFTELAVGASTVEVRHPATSSVLVDEIQLEPAGNELDRWILGERRVLTGAVIEDGEIGVPGAMVALVEPGAGHRYPAHELDESRILRQVESGAGGVFEINLSGLDLSRPLSLVASRRGYTSALLLEVDFDGPPATLFLREGNEIVIRANRAGSGQAEIDRFRLSYISDDPEEGTLDLGEISPGTNAEYFDVRPGRYRLEWGPEDLAFGVEADATEIFLRPGERGVLALDLSLDLLTMVGVVNGATLPTGWILVTDDPEDESRWRVGPIRAGQAIVPTPRGRDVYACAIPTTFGDSELLFAAGTILPTLLSSAALGSEPVVVSTTGTSLTFTFNDVAMRDAPLSVELPAWELFNGEWQKEGEVIIEIDETPFTLPLLPRGSVPYRIGTAGPGGWTIHQSVVLGENDAVIPIIR